MKNGMTAASDLLRLVGVMAIGIGVAWALQVLGFGGSSAFGKAIWVLSASVVAGVGAGLIFSSTSLRELEGATR